MARFTDKVAIVTGASQGLGPVMAKMLVDEGAKVVLAARRKELVEKHAAAIGGSAVAIRADVTQEADVAAMVDLAMSKWGKVDIMMNNAAAPGTDKFCWEQTLENWNHTIATDMTAAMLCMREVLRRSMLERKTGVIVNFSSGAGQRGMVRKTHYSAAKGGLIIFTRAVAMELADKGIRCNVVVPGPIDTELLQAYIHRIAKEKGITYEEQQAVLMADVPMKIPSTSEDVAHLALFLASDGARTITGQAVNVDGGWYMH
jgi:NAD(P)-dependent dehydrogenase (short-subunit alcohol dehydrogenase family)